MDERGRKLELEKGKQTGADKRSQIGRYRLMKKIGQGGAGSVYKAYDTKLERVVALKTLALGDMNEKAIQRFSREAKCNAKLCHPNIVVLHDFELIENTYCLTMEFINGTSLADLLKEQKLSIARSCEILLEILSAIQYAHQQGIIHRDLKPSNILLNKDGKTFLTDFGLAKALTDNSCKISQTGTLLGTPAYMSPEQAGANPNNPVDQRSDIYALGAMFYEMLTGKRVIEGDTVYNILFKIVGDKVKRPRELDAAIPPAIEKICMKALAKKKEERYQTAAEMAADIRKYQGTLHAEGPVTAVSGKLARYLPRQRRWTWALGIALLLAVGTTFLLMGDRNFLPRFLRNLPKASQQVEEIIDRLEERSLELSEDQKDVLRKGRDSYNHKDYRASRQYFKSLGRLMQQDKELREESLKIVKYLYLAELEKFTQRKDWTRAHEFIDEVQQKYSDKPSRSEMSDYVEQARENAFQQFYQYAKKYYKSKDWPRCAEAIQKAFEYHPGHPVLKDWASEAGPKVSGSKPEVWEEERWKVCWNDNEGWLDFTNPVWTKLSYAEQRQYATAYQSWYARILCNSVELEVWVADCKFFLVLIPPGKFWMGSPDHDPSREKDEKLRRVIIPRYFWVSRTEVTQSQWQTVMGNNPAYFDKSGPDAPVENISWNECAYFLGKVRMRLPTEAEWEYACRAGLPTLFNLGNHVYTEQVNFNPSGGSGGEYRQKTVPVGSLPNANAWRCYDFHGNVREWCSDWYSETPSEEKDTREPSGPSSGSYRAHRGGSWEQSVRACRSAHRQNAGPDSRSNQVGFRLCIGGR